MILDINSLMQDRNFILLITGWELIWKGLALWKSSKSDHKIIFALLLVFNTVGLFPIGYLIYSKIKDKNRKL